MRARLGRVLGTLAMFSSVAWCASDGLAVTPRSTLAPLDGSGHVAEDFAQATTNMLEFVALRYPPEQVRAYLGQWSPRFPGLCLFPTWDRWPLDPEGVLAEAVTMVAAEPTLGAPLLASAQGAGVVMCLDERHTGTFGYFEPRHGVIVVNRELDSTSLAVILVHELRHVEQHERGLSPTLEVDMTAYARAHLATEADAQAVMTLFAWRLRLLGLEEAWEAMLEFDRYADITTSFESVMEAGLSEVEATLAAFRAWAASEWRSTTYYQGACLTYLDLLDELHAFRCYGALSEGFLDGMCTLPDGEAYDCEPSDAWRNAP
ncbi:MAG: DUF6782 family putative metallopeptidase [Trueperaceae bacterium]